MGDSRDGIMGFTIGCVITMIILANIGIVKEARTLREYCQIGLADNLKCEMVYVKPEGI